MKTIKYSPDLVDQHGSKVFTGHVVIEIMSYSERMAYMSERGWHKLSEEQIADKFEEISAAMIEHIVGVDLVHIPTGQDITRLEHLEYSKEGQQLMSELTGVFMNGPNLGKLTH